MKNLLMIIPSMSPGGAERVVQNILTFLDPQKYELHLLLFQKTGQFLDEIPPHVKLHFLNKRSRWDFFRIILQIRKFLTQTSRPELVVSHLEYANLLTLIASSWMKSRPKILVTEQCFVTLHAESQRFRSLRHFLLRRLYPHADLVIAVSEGIKSDLRDSYGINPSKIQVIYNGVDLEKVSRMADESVEQEGLFEKGRKVICAAGRLTPQKNYPLLLKAFRILRDRMKARLIILGDGPDKQMLFRISTGLGVGDEVSFLGFQHNPYKYIARSDVYAMSSDFEGFPCVLLEAMACGVPVVSTRCPSGPDELIEHARNGLLVPCNDPEALAQAMERILSDSAFAGRLKTAGYQTSERFSMVENAKCWDSVIDSDTAENP